MTRRKILWTLAAGVPVLFGTAFAALQASGGNPNQANTCCAPDCCPPDCCEPSAGAKQEKPGDDCCSPDCCPPSCCSTAKQ